MSLASILTVYTCAKACRLPCYCLPPAISNHFMLTRVLSLSRKVAACEAEEELALVLTLRTYTLKVMNYSVLVNMIEKDKEHE